MGEEYDERSSSIGIRIYVVAHGLHRRTQISFVKSTSLIKNSNHQQFSSEQISEICEKNLRYGNDFIR
jgi:hypothetical protein